MRRIEREKERRRGGKKEGEEGREKLAREKDQVTSGSENVYDGGREERGVEGNEV